MFGSQLERCCLVALKSTEEEESLLYSTLFFYLQRRILSLHSVIILSIPVPVQESTILSRGGSFDQLYSCSSILRYLYLR